MLINNTACECGEQWGPSATKSTASNSTPLRMNVLGFERHVLKTRFITQGLDEAALRRDEKMKIPRNGMIYDRYLAVYYLNITETVHRRIPPTTPVPAIWASSVCVLPHLSNGSWSDPIPKNWKGKPRELPPWPGLKLMLSTPPVLGPTILTALLWSHSKRDWEIGMLRG